MGATVVVLVLEVVEARVAADATAVMAVGAVDAHRIRNGLLAVGVLVLVEDGPVAVLAEREYRLAFTNRASCPVLSR